MGFSGPSSPSSSPSVSPGATSARTWRPSSTAGCTSWAGPSGRSTGCSAPAPSRSRPGSATPARWSSSRRSRSAFTYLILRIQGSLPLNPQHLGAVPPALSFNTAASFVTNTNWQNYGGETTMSYFSQIGALTVQQFVSPAVGIAVAIAMVRGFSRRNSPTIGNFWVDITRCLLYILLPIAFVAGIIFVGQGAVQTLAGTVSIHDVAERRDPDHPPRPDRLHGGDQAARHQRRRLPQRQLGHHLREPDRPHQLAVDLPAAVHPLRPDLHLRQDGGQHPPRRRPAGGHGAHLRLLGGLHQLRRAPGQPGGRRRRRALRPSATPRARRCASATPRPRCSACRRPAPRPVRPTPPTTRSPRSAASAS